MTWIIEHWTDIAAAFIAFATAFYFFAKKLTPWKFDDAWADFLMQAARLLKRDSAASRRLKKIIEEEGKKL